MELFIAVYVGVDPIEHSCFIWANDEEEVERMYREHSRHLGDGPKLDVMISKMPRRFGAISIKEALSHAKLFAYHDDEQAA